MPPKQVTSPTWDPPHPHVNRPLKGSNNRICGSFPNLSHRQAIFYQFCFFCYLRLIKKKKIRDCGVFFFLLKFVELRIIIETADIFPLFFTLEDPVKYVKYSPERKLTFSVHPDVVNP